MAEKETGRIEAFSDGVFAVAITLLALDVHVPAFDKLPPGGLGAALLTQWPPVLLAYVTSFMSILVMWINHDRLFEHIQRKDRSLLLFNGLLLMVVTLFPVVTAMLAEYIQKPDAKLASMLYCAFSIVMATLFNLLWRHASKEGRLLAPDHDRHKVRLITEQYRFGPLLYGIAFAAAFFNAILGVCLSLALAIFFALPERSPKQSGTLD